MAKPVVRSYAPYAEILAWLQQHVGVLLWSQPIITWHGEGWHITSGATVAPRGQAARTYFDVEFDDPKHATHFALIWQ